MNITQTGKTKLWSAAVAGVLLAGAFAATLPAQTPAGGGAQRVIVDDDGTVHVPAQVVPMSSFLSPEAKAYVTAHLKAMQAPQGGGEDGMPGYMIPYRNQQRELYPTERQDTQIAGVHTYVYAPKAGIAPKNKNRVLINLHGGGFSGCWPGCAELESIPVAGVAKIKVVAVDYRQGPKYKFPAASEDVAAVYKELLKTYRPENVGIYGCSAGGMLTAMSVAWFQKHDLPRPGAVGIFCAGAGSPTGVGFGGDANYTAQPLGEARLAPAAMPSGNESGGRGTGRGGLGYLSDTDPKDPLVAPINSPETLAKFPPTLIITGTRGFELSGALYTHTELVKQGVDAELHVWEGLFHGFFYNPDVPETRDAYNVMVKFFDRKLGKK
jgi:monoterpene epsilon-lactone hydrolase